MRFRLAAVIVMEALYAHFERPRDSLTRLLSRVPGEPNECVFLSWDFRIRLRSVGWPGETERFFSEKEASMVVLLRAAVQYSPYR